MEHIYHLAYVIVFRVVVVVIRVNRRNNQEWTTQRHWQHRIHKTQNTTNTRVNRRDNQEWTTQRHCQHRIHKTQDTINTRVNRRDNQEWTTQRHCQHRIYKIQQRKLKRWATWIQPKNSGVNLGARRVLIYWLMCKKKSGGVFYVSQYTVAHFTTND